MINFKMKKIGQLLILLFIACHSEISDEKLNALINEEIKKEDWTNAEKNLTELIKRDPNDPTIYECRAKVYTHYTDSGSTTKVINDINKCLELKPNNDFMRFVRFQAYFIKGKTGAALTDINNLCKKDSNNVGLLMWKADCQFNGQLFKEAAKTYQSILDIGTNYDMMVKAYYYLIYSEYLCGNYEKAWWDCGFLETRGFKKDTLLMKAISDHKLTYEGVAFKTMPVIKIDEIEELIKHTP
jgi:tetratricopeptide (TPR) repeat protein